MIIQCSPDEFIELAKKMFGKLSDSVQWKSPEQKSVGVIGLSPEPSKEMTDYLKAVEDMSYSKGA
jgi:hypothetical protein